MAEDQAHGLHAGAGGDRKTQRRQRIEGMRRRHRERNTPPVGLPLEEAIDKAALGRDFSRSLMAPMLQQRREQHRLHRDLELRREAAELRELQIRKRRYEVEIPGG